MSAEEDTKNLEEMVGEFYPPGKKLLWHKPTKQRITHPVIHKDKIFFKDDKGLKCLDALSGKKLWKYNKIEILPSFYNAIKPVFYSDLIIFLGQERKRDYPKSIRCLNEITGNEQWKFNNNEILGHLKLSGDKLFFGTTNKQNNVLYCLNTLSGKKIWEHKPKHKTRYRAITISDKHILFRNDYKKLFCLDKKTGKEKWHHDIMVQGNLITSNGIVLFRTCDEVFYCLNEQSGKILWKTKKASSSRKLILHKDKVYYSKREKFTRRDKFISSIDIKNAKIRRFYAQDQIIEFLIFKDDNILLTRGKFTKEKTYCMSLKEKGTKLLWKFKHRNKYSGRKSPATKFNRVYLSKEKILSPNHKLYCLDANSGKKLWKHKTKGEIEDTPIISLGCILFNTRKGIYCLGSTDPMAKFARRLVTKDQTLPIELKSLKPKKRLGIIKSLETLVREGEKKGLVYEELKRYAEKCGVYVD